MKRYLVTLSNGKGKVEQSFETDSPSVAINRWLQYSSKSIMVSSISCGSIEDCKSLYRDFIDRGIDLFNKYWKGKSMDLGFSYFEKSCLEYLYGVRKINFKGNAKSYDFVKPFCNIYN